MTHVRTIIRQRFISVLTDALPAAAYEVLGAREGKRNRTTTESLVDVRFGDIAVSADTMGKNRDHIAQLMIRVQTEGTEETLDDLLDENEVQVCRAVYNIDWSQLLSDEPELQQISFLRDAETETAIGVIIMQFQIEYRIDKRNPETIKR